MVNATWLDLARLPLATLFNCVTLKLLPKPVGQAYAECTYLPCRFLNLLNSKKGYVKQQNLHNLNWPDF